jgi:hypothetical protein
MSHNLATVYPYPSVVVHRAKVQDRSPAIGRHVKFPLIPARAMKIAVADTAFV